MKNLLKEILYPLLIMVVSAAVTFAITLSTADATINGKIDKVETRLDGRITEVDIKHDGKSAVLAERCANTQTMIAEYHKEELELKKIIIDRLDKLGAK